MFMQISELSSQMRSKIITYVTTTYVTTRNDYVTHNFWLMVRLLVKWLGGLTLSQRVTHYHVIGAAQYITMCVVPKRNVIHFKIARKS